MSSEQHDNHGTIFQRIIRPFLILAGLTAIEFIVAFTVPEAFSGVKVTIYILLTIAKAFYIVAYFMHLKFERLNLAYSIVIPSVLLLYLIALLIIEGGGYFA